MAPKNVYYVEVKRGVGPDLSYRMKGGGMYSDRNHAETQMERLTTFGKEVKLLVGTVTWEEA